QLEDLVGRPAAAHHGAAQGDQPLGQRPAEPARDARQDDQLALVPHDLPSRVAIPPPPCRHPTPIFPGPPGEGKEKGPSPRPSARAVVPSGSPLPRRERGKDSGPVPACNTLYFYV